MSSRQRLGAIDTAMILHDEFWRLALYTHTEHPTEALFGIMCHLARCSKWATSRLVQYVMEGVSDCVVDAYGPYVAAAVALARLGGPQDTDKRPDADPSAPEMPLFEGRGRALALGMMRVVQAQQEFHKEMAEGVLCLVQMCGVSLVSVCVYAMACLALLDTTAPLLVLLLLHTARGSVLPRVPQVLAQSLPRVRGRPGHSKQHRSPGASSGPRLWHHSRRRTGHKPAGAGA